nr:MAG: hypothetical protein [Microviridae sp.]
MGFKNYGHAKSRGRSSKRTFGKKGGLERYHKNAHGHHKRGATIKRYGVSRGGIRL